MKKNDFILQEGKRDEALGVFLPYFQKRKINITISQLKQALLAKFVNEANIHNLSLSSNFYLLGVARYYFNGDLTTNPRLGILYGNRDKFNSEICQRLDALIEILRNSYIDSVGTVWEQPEDFGNLTIDKLLKKYNSKINQALGIATKPKKTQEVEEPIIDSDTSAGKNYTYEIMYSYEDCKKFNNATSPGSWCITYGQQHYDAYVRRLGIHYVVFKRNGYENIPRKIGANFTKKKPQDEYGNSLICVLQSNKSPEPVYITSRWNHGSSVDGTQGTEADHAYTTEEFLNAIGCDYSVLERCFQQWSANKPKKQSVNRGASNAEKNSALRKFKYAQMLMNGGNRDYNHLFDNVNAYCNNPKAPLFVEINEGENIYYTLLDRGKLYFDDFLGKSINGVYITDWNVCDCGNFLRIQLDNTGDDKKQIYDLKRHNFLKINNKTSFKHVHDKYDIRGSNYFCVGLSGNQIAVINKQTLKPLQIQGKFWFENVKDFSNNHLYCGLGYGKVETRKIPSTIIELTYDSASGEVYYFNTATNSFCPPNFPDLGDGYIASDKKEIGNEIYLKASKIVNTMEKTYKTYDGTVRSMTIEDKIHRYLNLKTNEPLNINGITEFERLMVKDDIIGYELYNDPKEEIHFYNLYLNEPITINGEEFVTHGKNPYGHLGVDSKDNTIYFINTNFQRENDYIYIYNSKTGMFLYNMCFKSVKQQYEIFGGRYRRYTNNYTLEPLNGDNEQTISMKEIIELTQAPSMAMSEGKLSLIRLTENQFYNFINESVKRIINEYLI